MIEPIKTICVVVLIITWPILFLFEKLSTEHIVWLNKSRKILYLVVAIIWMCAGLTEFIISVIELFKG